jgi:F0F1-type ATP synthase delta subunit
LLKKLNALQISQLEKYKLSLLKEKKYSQSKQKKSIVFSLAPNSIPKAILESAAPTALSKKRALKQLLLRKTGVPFQVNYKINQGLISGFRLELLGVVIESNLLSLIQNATKIK